MGKKGSTWSKKFDITLHNEFEDTILMYEFLKHSHAIKALAALEKDFKIETSDKVREKLIQNKMNPRR